MGLVLGLDIPVGVETSFVVMIAPLLLTTMMGPELLLGMAALEGFGKILLGCICWVMIFTPAHIQEYHVPFLMWLFI